MSPRPILSSTLRLGAATLLLVGAVGCGRKLIPTPNIYALGLREPFTDVAPEDRTPEARILYVTDRQPIDDPDRPRLHYGWKRSRSLVLGEAVVSLGDGVSWDDLVADAKTADRTLKLAPKVTEADELVRLPATPYPVIYAEDGTWTYTPEAIEEVTRKAETIAEIFAERLARTPRKEVYLFVHGFNNTFEDAAVRMAELWHILGREGVPILYSWPAGRGGLSGYAYDRESGEFTVFHLRQLLSFLARTASIEGIHIVAHSRGTDVATSALRELIIAERAAGRNARESLKIRNVVIAASDLDIEVVTQRLVAERWGDAIGRMTIYRTDEDRALGLSSWLFDSIARIGTLTYQEVPEDIRGVHSGRAAIIDARVSTGFLGHSYFLDSPAVSSDLVLVLRDDRAPGAEHGRPLEPAELGWWIMRDGYPGTPADEGH